MNQNEEIDKLMQSIKSQRENFLNYVEQDILRREKLKNRIKTWSVLPIILIAFILETSNSHFYIPGFCLTKFITMLFIDVFTSYGLIEMVFNLIELLI